MTEQSLSEAEYDAITDAAAHWCMRMHASDCTADEREAFHQWHAADPLHAFEYAAMLEIWDVADHLPRSAAVAPARVTSRRGRWRAYAVAAAIALLGLPLAALTGWQAGWLPSSYEHYQTQNQLRKVTLADGSEVELNVGTDLVYSNYKDERRVTLKKGEAFFNVSHDRDHPFVVRAGARQIRVTGTQFNVWKYRDKVQVMLLEGSVNITRNDGRNALSLSPGMQASYDRLDPVPRVSPFAPTGSALAWRSGKLILDNLALADALPLINRYLSKPVMLADAATGTIRIGGIYNVQEVSHLVSSLPKVLPVYLTRNNDGNTVLNSIPGKAPKS